MLPGKKNGKVYDFNSAMEGVGACKDGTVSEEELEALAMNSCPGCGSCSGLFTANSMNCLTEALGMGIPYNGTLCVTFWRKKKDGKICRYVCYGVT